MMNMGIRRRLGTVHSKTETPTQDCVFARSGRRRRARLITVLGAGYAIGHATGGRATGAIRPDGFSLEGGPAMICIAVVALYFVLGYRFGGTLWQRILHAR